MTYNVFSGTLNPTHSRVQVKFLATKEMDGFDIFGSSVKACLGCHPLLPGSECG